MTGNGLEGKKSGQIPGDSMIHRALSKLGLIRLEERTVREVVLQKSIRKYLSCRE